MEITEYVKDVLSAKICPYCKSKTRLVSEFFVYGQTFNSKRKIICCKNFPHCNSYVGTDNDKNPLGRLSNSKLRKWKIEAHKYFDIIWMEKYKDREELYEMLSDELNIPAEYTHIGMFNIATCKKVVTWCKELHIKYGIEL